MNSTWAEVNFFCISYINYYHFFLFCVALGQKQKYPLKKLNFFSVSQYFETKVQNIMNMQTKQKQQSNLY